MLRSGFHDSDSRNICSIAELKMLVFLPLQSWKGTFKVQEKTAFVIIIPHLFLKKKGKS